MCVYIYAFACCYAPNPLLCSFFFLFLQKRIGGLYRMQLYNNGYQEVTRDRNDIRFRMCDTMLVQRFDRSVGRSVNAL